MAAAGFAALPGVQLPPGLDRPIRPSSHGAAGSGFGARAPEMAALGLLALAAPCRCRTARRAEGPDRGFRILEVASSFLGGQKSLVKAARWGSREAWRLMVRELAPQSPEGDYMRPRSELVASKDKAPLRSEGYALYLGNTCPWCHRAKLALILRRLPPRCVADVKLVDNAERASRGGWAFDPQQGAVDPVFGAADLREVYDRAAGRDGSGYVGRCTAPLLVDTRSRRAVSNDSVQIVRLIGTASETDEERSQGRAVDLVPQELIGQIEATTRWTYELLSNAVYRAGFATTQEAFARAARDVAEGLQRVEEQLAGSRFLCGDRLTEADVMLLPCAARFDAVYASLFLRGSCGLWREGEHRRRWLQRCWSLPGVPHTVDLRACQESYFRSLFPLNPSQIVPVPASDPGALGTESISEEDLDEFFHWRKV
ncbi:gto2 [Symbiodinium necroappetens]|uniref:Gto2 protein n=1 Tax=Symbiodinium necroappetens TaxID=1628268 RepID=A0A812JAQ7_9DINO|nr:gto2 [Symbiodinium necroappetens]